MATNVKIATALLAASYNTAFGASLGEKMLVATHPAADKEEGKIAAMKLAARVPAEVVVG